MPTLIEGFLARRRGRWERLTALLDRVRSPRQPLSVDELDELAALYRRTTSDLAIARRDFPSDRSTFFINQLVARAHAVIYRERPTPFRQLRRYFTAELPREFRAAWPYMIASALLFFGPWIAITVAIIVEPKVAELVLPPSMLSEIRSGETWFDIDLPKRSLASSLIMTNNIRVSLLALGGGMLAGLGTAAALLYNGVFLGAVFGALIAYGLADKLFGFVSPHSSFELSTIVIAGGCGLMLGRAIVWPGLLPRGLALQAAAGRAVRLLTATLPLLVMAGLIEGFVSPAHFAWPFKVAIGLATGIALYAYLLLVGRESAIVPSPSGRG